MIRYSIAILILLLTASCSTISNFNETDKDIVVKSQSGNYLGIEATDPVSYTHLTLPTKA